MNGDPSTESHLRIPVLPVELLPLDENAIAQVDGDGVLASLGMDAGRAKFVVVKNPMNYRIGYAGRSKGEIVLDTPGPTTAILSNIEYQKLQRPYFPADRNTGPEATGVQPVIYRHATVSGA